MMKICMLEGEINNESCSGNVGAVYLAMGDFDSAVQCHMEHLQIAKRLGNKVEEARAYSNLGRLKK
jgi:Tetratricopeptide repeat